MVSADLIAGVLSAVMVLSAQRPPDNTAWRARLADARALTPEEIDQLLDAVRSAEGGRPFHFAADRGAVAWDILIERDGHARYVRAQQPSGATFTEYTGRIARDCDGSVSAGEFVVEYRRAAGRWNAAARASSPADLLRPVFDMLLGLKPLVDAGITMDGMRKLSVAWNLNAGGRAQSRAGGGGAGGGGFVLSDPTISGVESLTIDPATLLPARWEFVFSQVVPADPPMTAGYRFAFDPTLTVAPPPGDVAVPSCIDTTRALFPR